MSALVNGAEATGLYLQRAGELVEVAGSGNQIETVNITLKREENAPQCNYYCLDEKGELNSSYIYKTKTIKVVKNSMFVVETHQRTASTDILPSSSRKTSIWAEYLDAYLVVDDGTLTVKKRT